METRSRLFVAIFALLLGAPVVGAFASSATPPAQTSWTSAVSNFAHQLWDLGQPPPVSPPPVPPPPVQPQPVQPPPPEKPTEKDQPNTLERAAVVAIALLAAFLTAVQVWQIPPPSKRITTSEPGLQAAEAPAPKPSAGSEAAKANPSASLGALFLANNFTRTVLSGLTGLAAVTFLESFWKPETQGGLNVKSYYLVLFVVFFLVILLLSALFLSFNEAVRSRIILKRPAIPPLQPLRQGSHRGGFAFRWRQFWRWAGHYLRRLWNWLASWRLALVVFIDTFFNFIQGRNQLRAAVFSDHIVDLHESMLQAAEEVRTNVHRAVLQALLRRRALPPNLPLDERIRVGVSLLSSDHSKVYYIAHERGSLHDCFERLSVAWVSAFVGEARWCKSFQGDRPAAGERTDWRQIYANNNDAVLYHNRGIVPGPVQPLFLPQYYQTRSAEDYQAFVVLPMPWTRRGMAGEHRRGAIHISFKDASYMDKLWVGLERYTARKANGELILVPAYEAWKGLLETLPAAEKGENLDAELQPTDAETGKIEAANLKLRADALEALVEGQVIERPNSGWTAEALQQPLFTVDRELAAVLHQALEVLGAALAHFDDEVYEDYVQLRLHTSTS